MQVASVSCMQREPDAFNFYAPFVRVSSHDKPFAAAGVSPLGRTSYPSPITRKFRV